MWGEAGWRGRTASWMALQSCGPTGTTASQPHLPGVLLGRAGREARGLGSKARSLPPPVAAQAAWQREVVVTHTRAGPHLYFTLLPHTDPYPRKPSQSHCPSKVPGDVRAQALRLRRAKHRASSAFLLSLAVSSPQPMLLFLVTQVSQPVSTHGRIKGGVTLQPRCTPFQN